MSKPDDTLIDDLPSGGQTRFSTIFGAIGNYGMIGAGVSYGLTLVNNTLTKNHKPMDKMTKIGLGITGVGVVLGAFHGVVEANSIQHYREAVANKIDGLEKRVITDHEKITQLYETVQAQEQARAATGR